MATTPGTLTYWGVKARGYAPMVIAKHAGIPITQVTEFDLAALKPSLPFGQLPYLEHGDVKLAQSAAITRYLSKVGGLDGDNLAEFALSEMLIEEAADIFTALGKANYSENKSAAYDAAFAPGGSVYSQLQHLEKLHSGESTFFKPGPKRLAGGICLACVLDIANDLEPAFLNDFPKLKGFYDSMMELPAFVEVKASLVPYMTRA